MRDVAVASSNIFISICLCEKAFIQFIRQTCLLDQPFWRVILEALLAKPTLCNAGAGTVAQFRYTYTMYLVKG